MTRYVDQTRGPFQTPIVWSACLGTVCCVLFYGLLEFGPFRLPLVERYAKCHAVAYASVELFFIALFALIHKSIESRRELLLLRACDSAIEEIKIARTDQISSEPLDQIHWLEAAWKAQPAAVFTSAIGARVRELLAIQVRRKSLTHVDSDLQAASDRAADDQHDSYAMVRIVTWAMPMLGFLGTVIGISNTLGKMDAAALASGSQEAMNSLTAGLYVAFDTTAVGLVLTMVVMFVQFSINKSELRLLSSIDRMVADLFESCLLHIPKAPELSYVETALEQVTNRLLQSVELSINKQAELWHQSIETAQQKWLTLSAEASELVRDSLKQAIEGSTEVVHKTLVEANTTIAKTHLDGSLRLAEINAHAFEKVQQQTAAWQAQMLDQAKQSEALHQEMQAMANRLADLVANSNLIQALEEPIQTTLHRLTDIDRFHDAAICLTEAVAVLGTQMERYGYIGRQPVRRRSATGSSQDCSDEPSILPLKRKAG